MMKLQKHNLHQVNYIIHAFIIIITAMFLSNCSPKVDNRGNVDVNDNIAKITPHESHKQDVMKLLGSPSTKSSFGEDTWYYINARKEAITFFKPKVAEQNVVAIKFNNSGMVTEVDRFSKKDSQKVAIIDKITPTEGHKLGFFEQIFGNFGKFNKPVQEAR